MIGRRVTDDLGRYQCVVVEDLAVAADVGRDDGHPGRHRVQKGVGAVLPLGDLHQHIRPCQRGLRLEKPREVDGLFHAEVPGQGHQVVLGRSFSRDAKHRGRFLRRDDREGPDHGVDPFLGCEPGQRQIPGPASARDPSTFTVHGLTHGGDVDAVAHHPYVTRTPCLDHEATSRCGDRDRPIGDAQSGRVDQVHDACSPEGGLVGRVPGRYAVFRGHECRRRTDPGHDRGKFHPADHGRGDDVGIGEVGVDHVRPEPTDDAMQGSRRTEEARSRTECTGDDARPLVAQAGCQLPLGAQHRDVPSRQTGPGDVEHVPGYSPILRHGNNPEGPRHAYSHGSGRSGAALRCPDPPQTHLWCMFPHHDTISTGATGPYPVTPVELPSRLRRTGS